MKIEELKEDLQKYQVQMIQYDYLHKKTQGICEYIENKIKDYEQKKPEETEKEDETERKNETADREDDRSDYEYYG